MKVSPALLLTLGAMIGVAGACSEPTEPTPIAPPEPPPVPSPALLTDGYLYVASADGSAITPIGRGWAPNWSPDGRRIAYHSFRDGDAEIFVVNADGSGVAQITRNTVGDRGPHWSPRGDRIAFTRDRTGGGGQLHVMKADGTDVTALTSDPIIADIGYYATAPWSPDGRRLAFTFRTPGGVASGGLAVINSDGSGLIRLTAETMAADNPAWSPDQRRIAFDTGGSTYVINADGSGLMNLTPWPASDRAPAWSPDGRKIAVARDPSAELWEDARRSVWVMNADGTGATELTGTHTERALRWSPDGRQILYGDRGIQSVQIATGVVRTFIPHGSDPRPSPDGTRIVFVMGSPL